MRGLHRLPNLIKLRMPSREYTGVRLWGISFIVKRERAQTSSLGPKVRVKWKRMWDFKDNQDVGSEAATHLKSA